MSYFMARKRLDDYPPGKRTLRALSRRLWQSKLARGLAAAYRSVTAGLPARGMRALFSCAAGKFPRAL